MTSPEEEGRAVDDVSDGEEERREEEERRAGEERRMGSVITAEFVKQHFNELRELVLEQEKKEKLKKVVDDVLRDATITQETISKHVGNGETPYQRVIQDPLFTSVMQGEPSRNKRGECVRSESLENGKQRTLSPIRKMAPLTGPHKSLFQARRKDGFELEKEEMEGEGRWEEDDDLTKPYQRKAQSRFTKRIATAPKPKNLKMPSHIKTYDGLRDPDDHMSLFCAAAENHSDWTMPVWCHMFEQTLEGPARLWFNSLPPESIDGFEELQDKFEAHFMHQRRYEKDPVEIHNIKQGENESILNFLKRFNKESMEIKGATESMRVSGYMHAIRNKQLIEELNRAVPQTMKEAEQRSRDFVRGKEAVALADEPRRKDIKSMSPWKKEPFDRFPNGSARRRFDWNKEDRGNKPFVPYSPPREGNKRVFTTLIKTPCEILATEPVAKKFNPPTPGKNTTGPSDRFCDYHQGTGHNTNGCYQLRRRIEEAVQSGELAHLVKDIRTVRGQTTKKLKINMISMNRNPYKQRAGEPRWMKDPITFWPEISHGLTDQALVIEARTRETHIEQILVDTGAAIGTIYEHFFRKLPRRVKECLEEANADLEDFNGGKHRPIGKIFLPITLGAYPRIRTERMEFLVIKGSGRYDMVMGRPGLLSLRAIPSTIHSVLVFPTRSGTAIVRGIPEEEERFVGNPTMHTFQSIGRSQPTPGWLNQEISFAPQNECVPTDEALIVTGRIGQKEIPRILVDSGSSAEIMYDHCFRELPEEEQQKITRRTEVIEGFGGQMSTTMGTIALPLTMGVGRRSRTEKISFSIVKAPAHYSIILGRPGLKSFHAVASTLHSQLKFPSPGGIVTIRGERRRGECLQIEPKKRPKRMVEKRCMEPMVESNGVLTHNCRSELISLLEEYQDVFAWHPSDMTGIPRDLAEHRLNARPGMTPVRQKRRAMAPDRLKAIREEVDKLVEAGILREVEYQTWIANPVMVPKSDGSWRMCIDFKDINKACPKDNYPLPEIDWKVESLVGYKYKCFLDAYKGYHQIQMAEEDEDKTAFYTEHKLYCYRKMPFGLVNAGATYQRLVDKVFSHQMGRNLEVYVDDLVIKSKTEAGLLLDIRETFNTLRKINMKLNPKKCTFGAKEGKFLGHFVTEEGLKVCPDKIEAVIKMKSPTSLKEVQSLNGKLASMSRYFSKLAEKSLPFFKTLQKCINKNSFKWTEEAEIAFEKIKEHILTLPMLTAPTIGEELLLYLATSPETISAVLMTERKGAQRPVYFISKTLVGAEVNYTPMEKLALALIHSARRLRRYFQAYKIVVMTTMPLKEVLAKPEKSGRLAKWAIEIGEHAVEYRPRTAVKGQILADFIAEVPIPEPPKLGEKTVEEEGSRKSSWILYTDGAANKEGSGGGVVLVNDEGVELTYALRFNFPCTNNEAEYEALIAGVKIASRLKVKSIEIKVDSALVANQVMGDYASKEKTMAQYREYVLQLLEHFDEWKIEQIPRSENTKADAASKLASATHKDVTGGTPIEILEERSINRKEVNEIVGEEEPCWMSPIWRFLENGELPMNKAEARKIESKSLRYVMQDGVLYKRSFLMPLLRCVGPLQANYILREVHEGACGLHHGPRMLVAKLTNLGYFWPSMHRDAIEITRRCPQCQKFAPVPKQPKTDLVSVTSAWPFHQWGIDIVGPFPPAPGKVKFLVVAIDYFSKWIEAKPLAKITGKNVKNFIWKNIVCRYGIPGTLISDNGKQFAENPLKAWCTEMKITQKFTSVAHPQANGQVERANRSLVEGLKKRLEKEGGNWVDHLSHVLWAHRTTPKTSNGETPFSLTYGTEAVIPAEIGIPTKRVNNICEETNDKALRENLDILEERREIAAIREAAYKKKLEQYYNQRVKQQALQVGDWVLRKNEASLAQPIGKMAPNWEGPYKVKKVLGGGSYKLTTSEGKEVPRTWNIMNLKKYFV